MLRAAEPCAHASRRYPLFQPHRGEGALQAPKAPTMYPGWTARLAADLFTESQTFVDQVFWNDGHLSSSSPLRIRS